MELSYTEIQAFRKIGYGALPAYMSQDGLSWHTDFQICLPTAEVKSREMKTAKIETSIALHVIDSFPLIRMAVTIYSIPDDPAKMEVFFNLTRQDSVKLVISLTQQTKLNLHLYGDNLKYSHTKQINWYLQPNVTDIMIRAAAMIEGKTDADFEQAKQKFMKENDL